MTCGTTTGCNRNCNQGRACPGHIKKPAPAWLNPVLVVSMVVMLCFVGPTIDNRGYEHTVAKDAIAQQRQQARFDKAIKEMGRENGACFQTDKPGELQCFTHRGAKTVTTKVSP